jgi:S-adenosylmethionine:tRNA ribosyltransferase-isomerase
MNAPNMPTQYRLSDFDFELPPELIAQHPAAVRSQSRLLDGTGLTPIDRVFADVPQCLHPGDLLVFNDTQVVKARLYGEKASGGKVEMLVERVLADNELAGDEGSFALHAPAEANSHVVVHLKANKKPAIGSKLLMAGYSADTPSQGFEATLLGRWPDETGGLFRFRLNRDAYDVMSHHGHVPLPPYITHADDATDETRYQTIFARHPGAVAAPTAALHFDQTVLDAMDARGIARASVTLHVGAGTFSPVKTQDLSEHVMHAERYNVPTETIQAVANCRARGGRVIAVGTTSIRTLESWALTGQVNGDTSIFITPGFEFKVVDALITNFHLPKSTLMMLISALAGHGHVMALYQHAIAQRYRFFSYGDAMLLQRQASRERSQAM